MRDHYVRVGEGIEGYLYCKESDKGDRILAVGPPPHFDFIVEDDGSYTKVDNPQEISQQRQLEMARELDWCDLQVKFHISSDRRAIATIEDIYAHARDCRDHVRNIDGVLTIVGDKPVRPS